MRVSGRGEEGVGRGVGVAGLLIIHCSTLR